MWLTFNEGQKHQVWENSRCDFHHQPVTLLFGRHENEVFFLGERAAKVLFEENLMAELDFGQ